MPNQYRKFVSEAISRKVTYDVPGISSAAGRKLAAHGYVMATSLLGKYLILNNEEAFKDFLKETAGSNARNAMACYAALTEWCDNFIL